MEEVKRFDIVEVDFSGAIGSEQGKIRPAIIIQNDIGNKYAPTTIVMPLSSVQKNLHMPTHTLIKKNNKNGLKVDSVVLGEQMRVISKTRIMKRIGKIIDVDSQKNIKQIYIASFGL